MTFTEAKEELKRLANGSHCSIDVTLNIFSDGREKPESKCYIENIGWASAGASHGIAISNMQALISQVANPDSVTEMFPE